MFAAAVLGHRAPHSAISMQAPFKMLNGTEPDLRLLRDIGARASVRIKTYTKKLELNAVERRLVGYSNTSKTLPRLYSGRLTHHGEQKRHLYRDAVAPAFTTFG